MKSGSTRQNAGSVPLRASAKNCSVLRTCRMYRPKPTGNTSAVNWMSFWMPCATDGWNRPADSSRRLVIRLLWWRVPAEPGLVAGHRVVVHPGDAVPGQRVEDGPVRRVVEQIVGRVADQAVSRAGDQEPAVGERRAQARAEPPVGQRERAGQPVVERQVLLGPVAHGHRGRFGPVRRPAHRRPAGWRSRTRRRTRPATGGGWRASSATGSRPAAGSRPGDGRGPARRRPRCSTRPARRPRRAGSRRRGRAACPGSCRTNGSPSSARRCARSAAAGRCPAAGTDQGAPPGPPPAPRNAMCGRASRPVPAGPTCLAASAASCLRCP